MNFNEINFFNHQNFNIKKKKIVYSLLFFFLKETQTQGSVSEQTTTTPALTTTLTEIAALSFSKYTLSIYIIIKKKNTV